jgi:zinc/manganese transport system ATP-binding protein
MQESPEYTIQLHQARLTRDHRTLWDDLSIRVRPGEFITVLGPNGAGKTSLLKVLLGLVPLESGSVDILGKPARRGNTHIGYIPQQKSFDADIPIRGRDLVQLGATGYHYGMREHGPIGQGYIDEAIKAVGADSYADMPLGLLSGGEQQRLRAAQALVGEPEILLCDEPLLSLDIASQQAITKLIDIYRKTNKASVIFVTHEINPVLPYVDRILYLANGRWLIDTPDKVMRSDTLSELYGTNVEVVRINGRILVLNGEDAELPHHHGDDQ